jgi:uncharacterized cupredoxin-like copper-binding protein
MQHIASLPTYLIAFLLPLLAGCAVSDRLAPADAAATEQVEAATAGVDWTQAETVTVELSEFAFAPQDLALVAGQPYRLRLVNVGGSAHTFTAPAFFAAVAVDRLETPDGTLTAPLLESVALGAGEAKDLLLVPVKAGDYPLDCEKPLHASFGMIGSITISAATS